MKRASVWINFVQMRECYRIITELVRLEETSGNYLVQPSCTEQAVQHCVQVGVEYLRGILREQRLHGVSGQPV